ncbi:MAG: hypothetical protein ACKVT1_04510 [Dehalococcoidia bacterium]
MAFTVVDVEDLLRVLRENPEMRAAARREILGEELLALPDLVRQNSADIQALERVVAQNSADIRELRQIVEDFARAADVRFNRIEGRTGSMAGQLAELRWATNFSGRFGSVVRRARLVVPADLELFEAADEQGAISEVQARAVRELDLILQGVRGRGAQREEVLLAVEISLLIERSDVERAIARAETLRNVGYNAVPVVAGARMDAALRDQAVARGVEVLLHSGDVEEPAA